MLDPRAYGLAMGFVYSVYMALLAWGGGLFHVGGGASQLMKAFYPGYTFSLTGGVVGAVYGFATGYLLGWATGWLYNQLRYAPSRVPGNVPPTD